MIEIIVTIVIFSGLFVLGLFATIEAFKGSIYRSEVGTIVSLLQKVRNEAISNIDQTTWGVCYLAPNYVIIKGSAVCNSTSVVESIAANNAVAAASNFATPGKFPVIVFSQLSGDPNSPASITVIQDNRTSVVQINNEGTISW